MSATVIAPMNMRIWEKCDVKEMVSVPPLLICSNLLKVLFLWLHNHLYVICCCRYCYVNAGFFTSEQLCNSIRFKVAECCSIILVIRDWYPYLYFCGTYLRLTRASFVPWVSIANGPDDAQPWARQHSSVLGKCRSILLPFLFVSCLSRFSLLCTNICTSVKITLFFPWGWHKQQFHSRQ